MEALLSEAMKMFPPGQVLVLVVLWMLVNMIRDMRDEFRQVYSSVEKLEVWAREHEKRDDDRFQELRQMRVHCK